MDYTGGSFVSVVASLLGRAGRRRVLINGDPSRADEIGLPIVGRGDR